MFRDFQLYMKKKKAKLNFNDFFKRFEKKDKKILFYPAQFWPHKNHRYIIDALEHMVNENKITDFHVFFVDLINSTN